MPHLKKILTGAVTALAVAGVIVTHGASSHLLSADRYPNSTLTPGVTDPTLSAQILCDPSFSTKTIRNVPQSEKRQVYQEYNVSYPQPQGSVEVDHFISLELGGSNDIKNLWVEPASPMPGFHEKDKVENFLHKEVCSGKITLQEAQQEITGDWYAVYQQMGK